MLRTSTARDVSAGTKRTSSARSHTHNVMFCGGRGTRERAGRASRMMASARKQSRVQEKEERGSMASRLTVHAIVKAPPRARNRESDCTSPSRKISDEVGILRLRHPVRGGSAQDRAANTHICCADVGHHDQAAEAGLRAEPADPRPGAPLFGIGRPAGFK